MEGGGDTCVEKINDIAHAKLLPVPNRELEYKIPNGRETVEFLFLYELEISKHFLGGGGVACATLSILEFIL